MTRRLLQLVALLLGLALVAAACGDDDTTTTDTSTDTSEETEDTTEDTTESSEVASSDFQACEVTDTGGVDDKSFNETVNEGLEAGAAQVGGTASVLESSSDADYQPHIETFIEQGCDLIVTVGFLLGDATEAAAKEHTDQNFAIVDFAYETEYPNVLGLTFKTDEAAFLAGYVAADQTETGKVGTYGGLNIPTVTIFMEGFAAGIAYYNEENGTEVELIGWDPEADDGLFTGDFDDLTKGRSTTESLLDQGADIILPVAGPVGQGSIEALRADPSAGAKLIWVDTDGCVSLPDSCDLFLTSVQKKMDVAVEEAVVGAAEGEFAGGVYSGTLENGGVDLGPFHEYEGDISEELLAALEEIRAGIIDGSIPVTIG
jgi:basic membrane protein A